MTAAQLATLKTELQTDPRGYGYAALVAVGSDEGLSQVLNVIRDGSAGTMPGNPTGAGGQASGIVTVRRNDISGAEILQAVDPVGDVNAQTAPSAFLLAFFQSVAGMRQLSFVNADGSDNAVLASLKKCFATGSASRTNLGTISKRSGSRAEELFGAGVSLAAGDITATGIHG
jgi:hypothetical protein